MTQAKQPEGYKPRKGLISNLSKQISAKPPEKPKVIVPPAMQDNLGAQRAPEPAANQSSSRNTKAKSKAAAPSREDKEQVNIWTTKDNKHKVKMISAMHGLSLDEMLTEFLSLYEKEHGALPSPKKR